MRETPSGWFLFFFLVEGLVWVLIGRRVCVQNPTRSKPKRTYGQRGEEGPELLEGGLADELGAVGGEAEEDLGGGGGG